MGKLLLRSLLVVGLLSLLAFSAQCGVDHLAVGPGGELVVDNQTSLDVGGVTILTTGATGFTFNAALPALSLPDSVFVWTSGSLHTRRWSPTARQSECRLRLAGAARNLSAPTERLRDLLGRRASRGR